MTATHIYITFLGKINKEQAKDKLTEIFKKAGVDFKPTLIRTNQGLHWTFSGHERINQQRIGELESFFYSYEQRQQISLGNMTPIEDPNAHDNALILSVNRTLNGSSVAYNIVKNDFT